MIYEIEGRKQFSYRLRQALLRIGMKHKELAAAIGMNVHRMSNILCGRRALHVITLQKILIALPDIDARWLIVGEMTPELEISLAPQEWNFLQNKEPPVQAKESPRETKRKRSR